MCNGFLKIQSRSASTKRSGIMLIEMLVAIAILAVIMFLSAKMFRVFIADLPRTQRHFQSNTSVLDMLRQLRKDVEFSESVLEYTTDSGGVGTLSIDAAEGPIRYVFDDGRVTRNVTADDPNAVGEFMWPVPKAKISCRVWQRLDKGYALEVGTTIRYKTLGTWKEKLQNSHVYFVGASVIAESERL